MSWKAIILSSSCSLATLVCASQAWASEAAPAASETAQNQGIEDIVVTAQRREQRLQDVPVAVTALSADAMERQGVATTYDLPAAIPGLLLSKASTTVQPFLRGVGTASAVVGNDPSVAVYVDGVYNSAPTGLLFSFNNIERIEVLKGPQGTLFGRNATGGLIQIVTRDPTSELTAKASVGYSRFDAFQSNAYLSGGSDKIAADLSVMYNNQSKGWGKNKFNPSYLLPTVSPPVNPEAGTNEEFAIRSKIVIAPDDRTKIRLSGTYLRSDTDQGAYRNPLPGAVLTGGFTHDGGFWDYNSDVSWASLNKQYIFSADAAYEADFATIKSITSYLSADSHTELASDNTPNIGTHFGVDFDFRTFTQELQLLSNKGHGLDWLEYTAGLYYLHSSAGTIQHLVRGNYLSGIQDRHGAVETDSKAAYGQVTISVTDTTRITGGLRYTEDRISTEQFYVGTSAAANGIVSSIVPHASTKFSKLTWRLAIDQRVTPDVLLFASMSRGYKAGAYNAAGLCVDSPPPGQACASVSPAVSPEVLDSYEVGLKSDLLDRRMRINLAGFYYDYKNLQQTAVVGTPPILMLVNAAKARVYGAEIETVASLADGLTLNASATFLDAKYTSFPNAQVFVRAPINNISVVEDVSGNRMVRAPKLTLNAGVNWEIPTSLGDFNLNANWYHNSGFFWEASNRLKEDAYDTVNVSLGFSPDDHWTVRLWGRNIFNEKYYSFVSSASVGDHGAPAAPATYGITFEWKM